MTPNQPLLSKQGHVILIFASHHAATGGGQCPDNTIYYYLHKPRHSQNHNKPLTLLPAQCKIHQKTDLFIDPLSEQPKSHAPNSSPRIFCQTILSQDLQIVRWTKNTYYVQYSSRTYTPQESALCTKISRVSGSSFKR